MTREESRALYDQGREATAAADLEEAVTLLRRSHLVVPHHETLELIGECLPGLARPVEAIAPRNRRALGVTRVLGALMSVLFAVVGTLALLGPFDAKIAFWSRDAIEKREGKIAWIAASTVSLVLFSALAVGESRNGRDGPSD
ncbi:MAG: hypothetical protein GWM92_10740 [Gemmatimonadetes bacterium]|nr:hypothetical protein [Gemmatimonadota bacterium]NIR79173.1 hypothetical protein [Gemmatimonadota bacterium]NIU31689.1 hypothetical protein [Gemmatimonadota bacterium]NIU36308.1 hypothetical protein [Gemmatimonadota bacterium]NIV62043.1 hypothetical protein [Gemmatimonadota bacterium]